MSSSEWKPAEQEEAHAACWCAEDEGLMCHECVHALENAYERQARRISETACAIWLIPVPVAILATHVLHPLPALISGLAAIKFTICWLLELRQLRREYHEEQTSLDHEG